MSAVHHVILVMFMTIKLLKNVYVDKYERHNKDYTLYSLSSIYTWRELRLRNLLHYEAYIEQCFSNNIISTV